MKASAWHGGICAACSISRRREFRPRPARLECILMINDDALYCHPEKRLETNKMLHVLTGQKALTLLVVLAPVSPLPLSQPVKSPSSFAPTPPAAPTVDHHHLLLYLLVPPLSSSLLSRSGASHRFSPFIECKLSASLLHWAFCSASGRSDVHPHHAPWARLCLNGKSAARWPVSTVMRRRR